MAHLHLLLGPVGAGKSTLAAGMAEQHGAVVFNLDAWMARLFGDDERPESGRIDWYLERVDRCIDQIWQVVEQLVARGTPVVLELGLIRAVDRLAFYSRVDLLGAPLTIYVVDAPREVRRERVMRRNEQRGATFSTVVPLAFFEHASDLWEPPNTEERSERNVVDL